MATTMPNGGGQSLADGCSNAQEFVKQRLDEAEKPLSPIGLANEYDCTRSHMASEISQLVEAGDVKRVGRGQYERVEESDNDEEKDVSERGQTLETASVDEENDEGSDEGNDEDSTPEEGSEVASREEYEEQHEIGLKDVAAGVGAAGAAAATSAAGGDGAGVDGENGGGVPWGWVAVAIVGLVLVYLWLNRDSQDGSQPSEQQTAEQDDDEESIETPLIE